MPDDALPAANVFGPDRSIVAQRAMATHERARDARREAEDAGLFWLSDGSYDRIVARYTAAREVAASYYEYTGIAGTVPACPGPGTSVYDLPEEPTNG